MKRLTPNTQHSSSAAAGRDGVALIICLGLLAVMTLMAITFSISMRVERMAARNFADGVRAKHLVNAALVRAMKDIDAHMAPAIDARHRVYPAWDVTNSVASLLNTNWVNLLSGSVLRHIPGGILYSNAVAARPQWITTSKTNTYVAYLVVNSSGLIDANSFGSDSTGMLARTWSTGVNEVAINSAPEFHPGSNTVEFVQDRIRDIRYETLDELGVLSGALSTTNVPATTNFNVFSYDPGRDKVFLTVPVASAGSSWWQSIATTRPPRYLGTREAQYYLRDKFNINDITNQSVCRNFWLTQAPLSVMRTKYSSDATFMNGYFKQLTNILQAAVFLDTGQQVDRADDVAWNIVNYMDPDNYPQGVPNTDVPWTKSEGGESIPMVNEIIVEEKVVNRTGTNFYEYYVTAEVWYPYAPHRIIPSDDFGAQLWLWTKEPGALDELIITNAAYINTNVSRTITIPKMSYGDVDGPEYILISNVNAIVLSTTNSPSVRVDVNNFFQLLVRVTQGGNTTTNPFYIVDEAMGYDNTDTSESRRGLFKVNSLNRIGSYEINDPRSNGQVRYWDQRFEGYQRNGFFRLRGAGTRGEFNSVCSTYLLKGSGTPIFIKNAPLDNIAELGHIWRSNLDDELRSGADPRNAWWRSLDLMRKSEGPMLLDIMCTDSPRPPYTGVFSANSRQKDAWRVLFGNLSVGYEGVADATPGPVPDSARTAVINELVRTNYVSFYDMFNDSYSDDGGGGPLADAFRACLPVVMDDPNDIYQEDAFRKLCELLSFRQNIFTIILAAQVMSEEGAVPIAERRAVATVYRDAYTGRRFIRNFTWLDD